MTPRRATPKPPRFWARLSDKAKLAVVMGSLLGLAMCGTNVSMATGGYWKQAKRADVVTSPTAASTPVQVAPPRAVDPTTTTPAPYVPPKKGTALAALVDLPVDDKPEPGYRRTKFGKAWSDTDGNSCDQRNDVLRRDLRKRHTKPGSAGCILAKGVLVNPYTGNSVVFDRGDGDIQIDHIVSLHDAWNAGAANLDAKQRRLLANDSLNLIATSSHSNQSKGDDTADEWLPKEWTFGVRCAYVARQIKIKRTYKLSVTAAEHDAMQQVLQACPERKLPARKSFHFPKPRPIGEPKIKATPHSRPRPPVTPKRSTYYENCDAVRAAGAAPIHRGDPGYARHLDRDGDGVGCE